MNLAIAKGQDDEQSPALPAMCRGARGIVSRATALRAEAKWAWQYLWELAGERAGLVTLTPTAMAADLGVVERTARRWIKALEDVGLLIVVDQPKRGSQGMTIVDLVEPIECQGKLKLVRPSPQRELFTDPNEDSSVATSDTSARLITNSPTCCDTNSPTLSVVNSPPRQNREIKPKPPDQPKDRDEQYLLSLVQSRRKVLGIEDRVSAVDVARDVLTSNVLDKCINKQKTLDVSATVQTILERPPPPAGERWQRVDEWNRIIRSRLNELGDQDRFSKSWSRRMATSLVDGKLHPDELYKWLDQCAGPDTNAGKLMVCIYQRNAGRFGWPIRGKPR